MPSLFLFKRRWLMGSDDLVLPGILLISIHLTLFISIIVLLTSSSELNIWSSVDPEVIVDLNANQTSITLAKCARGLRLHSLFFVALLVAAVLLEVILTTLSMQGSIIDNERRKSIALVIYVRVVLGVVETFFSVAVVVHLCKLWGKCHTMQYLLNVEAATVAFNFIILFTMVVVLACTYDSSGHTFYRLLMAKDGLVTQQYLQEIIKEFEEKSKKSWKRRLRRCFCCARDSSNTNVALEEASHLLREFFKDLDIVPSDILAGLVLLRHKQQCIEMKKKSRNTGVEYMCGRPISDQIQFIDPFNSKEVDNLKNLIHYCNYSIASYGSLFYMLFNPLTGLYKLIDQCLCMGRVCCVGGGARSPVTIIEDDGCCAWQTSAFVRSLQGNVENTEIIYASLRNELYGQPFLICADYGKKTIVVTIRGTLSEFDALTDLIATPQVIPVDGNDGSLKCHKGILQGALYLKKRLVDDSLLTKAFQHNPDEGTDKFRLVLTGHSLGGGLAAALAIILHPLYPDLLCYSYSPPGGLLSSSAVEASRDYILTAVHGKDMIIRTGIHQLQKMRIDIVQLLCKNNLPKYKIVFGHRPCSKPRRGPSGTQVNTSSSILLSDNFDVLDQYERLYPPGRIFHFIYRSKKQKSNFLKKEESSNHVVEADNFNDFNEVLVSHNMVMHHWPQQLLKAMKKTLITPLPTATTKKYELSATIPSHARLRTNQQQQSNKPTPELDVASAEEDRALIAPEPSVEEQSSEDDRAHSRRSQSSPTITDPNEVSILLRRSSDPNRSSSQNNTNQHNNKEVSCDDVADISVSSDGATNIGSPSLLGHFEEYVDAVLPEPRRISVTSPVKPKRSCSIPRQAIDGQTLKRAQFEPNVIPKPPRSNSMVKPRAATIDTRDYPSVPRTQVEDPEVDPSHPQ